MSDIKEVLDVLSDLYTLVESDKIWKMHVDFKKMFCNISVDKEGVVINFLHRDKEGILLRS
jgi:hypothetical protein